MITYVQPIAYNYIRAVYKSTIARESYSMYIYMIAIICRVSSSAASYWENYATHSYAMHNTINGPVSAISPQGATPWRALEYAQPLPRERSFPCPACDW